MRTICQAQSARNLCQGLVSNLTVRSRALFLALSISLAGPCRSQTKGAEKVSPECKNRPVLNKSGPTAPYKFFPGESYKRSPIVKLQINEDGTVSNVKLIRSSGVKDINRKMLKAASGWEFKAVPGCILDSEATIDIDWE